MKKKFIGITGAVATGITGAIAVAGWFAGSKLVKVAADQRRLYEEGEFSTAISTRSLLAAAHQVSMGIALVRAFKACVANKFTSDGACESQRTRLEQLFQKH